jgi:hypothetical protein
MIRVRENSEVVMKFTQRYLYIYIYIHLYVYIVYVHNKH